MNTVICPHCKKQVEISEALRHEFNEQELEKIKAQHEKDLEEAQKKAEEISAKKIKQEFELDLKKAEKENADKDARIKDLFEKLEKMMDEQSALKKEKDELKIEMKKKFEEDEIKIREDAEKKAEESMHLKLKEKEKMLEDANKQVEEMKRKLQQGSQQMQGEVFELEFEELLQKEFPHDKISPVGKGIKGGDIIQEVWDARGNYNGKILWELKNTKTWTEGWVDKLKTDKRAINAEEAVLISEVLPTNIKTAGFKDGIWVTQKTFVIGLASALRANLIQLYYAKNANKGKDEKVEAIYSYLSGVEFKHRIEAIIDAFSNLQTDIEKEKRYFSTKWARDEKNIRQVIDNTFGMHGDFKGLMGSTLPTIKGLEAAELESGEE